MCLTLCNRLSYMSVRFCKPTHLMVPTTPWIPLNNDTNEIRYCKLKIRYR